MDYEFDPIILRYQGLDAERHVIDLGQLGQSIQGASQLLGSAGHLVVTGQYAKRSHALSVRVLAGTARESSWELPAILMSIAPAILPVFPTIAEIGKKAATTATTRIVNYALKKLAGNKSEAEMAFGLVEKAMAEVGQTSRHAMDVVERIATNNRPAARLFVVPIGESCTHVCLGETVDGAEPIDKAMRDAIEAPEPVEIGPSGTYRVLISEIDLINRSCKFTILGEPEATEDHRVNGEITDPALHTPGNSYTAAMNAQRPISVIAKPQIKDGDIEKLYISDIAPSTPLIAAS